MSPAAEAVVTRLDATRQKWWFFTLLSTTVAAVCVSFGLLLLFMLADAWLRFSQGTLQVFFFVWTATTLGLMVIVGRRLLRGQRSLEATARRVESAYPELGSDLINLLQLESAGSGQHGAFGEAAINEAAARIGIARFDGAARQHSRRHRFRHAMQTPRDLIEWLGLLGLLVVLAVVCHLLLPNWASAATRLMVPFEFKPSVGKVQIDVEPKDVTVVVGENVTITGKILPPDDDVVPKATLFVTPEGEEESPLPMAAGEPVDAEFRDETRRVIPYTLAVPSVTRSFTYRLEIGDSQTPVYAVEVRQRPTVVEATVTLDFPDYLDRGDETFTQTDLDLQVPQYSSARLQIRPSVPIVRGYLESAGRKIAGRVEEDGRLAVEMALAEDTTFTVHLFTAEEHTDPEPRVNHAHVIRDRPPAVQLISPDKDAAAAPGDDVPISIRANDDHGLSQVRLEMLVDERTPDDPNGEQPAPKRKAVTVVKPWTDFRSNSTTAFRQHVLALDPERFHAGQRILLRAVARDRRSVSGFGEDIRPQEADSGWHAIRLMAKSSQVATELAQLDELRSAIWRVLRQQVQARLGAAAVLDPVGRSGTPSYVAGQQVETRQAAAATTRSTGRSDTPSYMSQRTQLAAAVRTQQVEVQKSTLDIVAGIGTTDQSERIAIKRALHRLAFGHMLEATRQCDGIVRIESLEGFESPIAELLATQDRVIEALRGLLDAARRARSETLAEMPERPGNDLPDDVRRKLEELDAKLDDFAEQQKRVIEASENLAKTPVEDLTEEEEQLLRDLAAVEDDWSRFLGETHSDLSKLPEQDFADPSLLEEFVEIQTQISMAEDALLKKTADIAVPLEQLGYEMAEELRTNLEKWLPDTPDRDRWSQEEPPYDDGSEAPMAELPSELEDLIGELMEDEEDLFDEMEDVSSSAADSIDKGAGWDVADGPISNMSAKGATGNRLPNSSEIGGRSGEGRTGKSSGEFVGQEAVGKGGRKTPSRLTPDAYVQGQIRDTSKDPAGGASGGGKESGQGGEGLEGPAAPSPGRRELQRLAGKQAALRNQAETIQSRFEVMNYHQTNLEQMIDVMGQVEEDLIAGRPRAALRQREVLAEGLGNVKQFLQGEIEIRRDTTVNLPADVQQEMLGTMAEPSPPGWEAINQDYFRRLSEGSGGAGNSAPDQ